MEEVKMYYLSECEQITNCDIGDYNSYAILLFENQHLLDKISDVSTKKHIVESIVQRLNYSRVSPIHFCDIVSDLLCEINF